MKIKGSGGRDKGIIQFEFVAKTQLPESKVSIYFLEVAENKYFHFSVRFCKNRVEHLMQFLNIFLHNKYYKLIYINQLQLFL